MSSAGNNSLPGPVQAPPDRRADSVRRSSSLIVSWPDGLGRELQIDGRCRDLMTRHDGEVKTVSEAVLTAVVGPDRSIESITCTPADPRIGRLVGARAGNNLRRAIDDALPEQREIGSPLHLLLDDLGGVSLVAGFVWGSWGDRFPERLEELRLRFANEPPRVMEGICAGFRPGSSALNPDGTAGRSTEQRIVLVPSISSRDDPQGWHTMGEHPPMAMRRARRLDVWLEGEDVVVDAMFRDSAWRPDGLQHAVHEYQLHARANLADGRLTEVVAEPRILPYPECPAAAGNASRLVGTAMRDLRSAVLATLQKTDCCTHLNDALRSLAEVPILADAITRERAMKQS